MFRLNRLFLGLFPLALTTVVGCTKEDATPQEEILSCPGPDELPGSIRNLVGTWKLTRLECFCVPGLPNKMVTFTDTTFSFYQNDSLTYSGTYTPATAITCGLPATEPGLRFTYRPNKWGALTDAVFSVNRDTLVLDFGLPCDAPRETYERIQRCGTVTPTR